MSENKRYYWLKMPEDFFKSLRIKKLRNLAGGDTYTIIYLKLQLLSLNSEGVLQYKGIEKTFEEEIALEIDEDVENVIVTMNYLRTCGLLEIIDENHQILPWVIENTGSETASTIRSRKSRAVEKVLQCNTNATLPQHEGNGEIRDESEDIRDEKEDANASKKEGGKTAFRAPSIEDVEAYCKTEGFDQTDADDFVNFYEKKGWVVGKTKMKDWKAAVRNWENSERKRRGLPTIGEMRKAAEKKHREAETLVEYPVGSGRMIPEVQARREANRDGAFVEYPTGSGKFIPVYEAEAIRKGKPVNGK